MIRPDTRRARQGRYERVCHLVGLKPHHRVLDVGCGNGDSFEAFNQENEIVGLDLYPEQRIFQDNFRYVQGDAVDMSRFADGEFDVVVAIGLLEHIFPFDKLESVAREIQRVGKSYALVIPHMWTIIEPHHKLPFWQLYPDLLKSFLVSRFSISGYPRSREGQFRKLNYFSRAKWLELLPNSSIVSHNHISWLVRNFIVYGTSRQEDAVRQQPALQAVSG